MEVHEKSRQAVSGPEYELTSFRFSSSTSSYVPLSTTLRIPPRSILIRTTHSGICYTDVHAKPKECGLGHEGIGVVVGTGSAMTRFELGDRVGWGWLHSSCGHCRTCVSGYRQYCSEARGFAFSDLDQGAFGNGRIIDAEFAYKIPHGIASEHAAPLMCAGASVYEALDAAGTEEHHRVGVVGLGGLGHMAVLFARAMGCAVSVVSSDEGKIKDAFALGADEFRCSKDYRFLYHPHGGVSRSPQPMDIDTLLVTSNAVPDLKDLLPLLARRASIVLMTIQQDPVSIPYMDFVLPGHRLIASTEASRENHIRMLEFADRHGITPWVEVFPMDAAGLESAFGRLEAGKMRYRGVLKRA